MKKMKKVLSQSFAGHTGLRHFGTRYSASELHPVRRRQGGETEVDVEIPIDVDPPAVHPVAQLPALDLPPGQHR